MMGHGFSNKFEKKFGRYAIPNLSLYLVVCYAVGYLIYIVNPAFLGYLSQCFEGSLIPMLGAAFVSHGLGVWAGSLYASRINQVLLKRGIAVFSVLIALWKLFL